MNLTTESVVSSIREMFESLGIKVVSSIPYNETIPSGALSREVIVAGYIPGIACVFTAHVRDDFWTTRYVIDGEMKAGWSLHVMGRRLFGDVPRDARGSEGCGGDPFQFNINTNSRLDGDVASKILIGKEFFSNFLTRYKENLAPSFTRSVSLWFVSEYSDEYRELKRRTGDDLIASSSPFNERVIREFPAGFFASSQIT
jgi:hypothetical protein